MLDPYLDRIPWIQFGVYLLLGAKVDRVVTGRQACFLPADLESAAESASIHGASLEARKAHWLPQEFHPAIYPLIALIVWRCALERERTRVAPNGTGPQGDRLTDFG